MMSSPPPPAMNSYIPSPTPTPGPFMGLKGTTDAPSSYSQPWIVTQSELLRYAASFAGLVLWIMFVLLQDYWINGDLTLCRDQDRSIHYRSFRFVWKSEDHDE
ncbi:hypothetical protein F5Y15DRAFT_391476 [Xylariaceae sp. FL0016]|nr:hypothetical protein F5Y15DRAFT_391476 [Xylariaceae sp. FL0016]